MTSSRPTPWDFMGPAEAQILGDTIFDPEEQARWCRAMLFGTLPYMWLEKAPTVRRLMFDQLRMRRGDSILVIGECIAECRFDETIRAAIGPEGRLQVVDITAEARNAYMSGRRGRSGALATWPWRYTEALPAESFDAVAVLQAIQHTDDWAETGGELLRVLKPGRPIVLSEITFGPNMVNAASLDVHIQAWVDKIFSRIGWPVEAFPYYSPAQLHQAFAGRLREMEDFSWKGIDVFWGTKP